MLTRRLFLAGSSSFACSTALPTQSLGEEKPDYLIIPGKAKARLLEEQDILTDVWAYNDLVPGPVIRTNKGEEIRIEVVNQLDQPTSVHWHGIRIENAMDGVSNLTQEPILPGDRFEYRFTAPDAGTYWYHPHNRSWEQLARGLYGALIVEGDEPLKAFDRDYTIIADDWRLESEGKIHEASFASLRDWSHAGRLGNILTLNGKPYEELQVVPGERLRLRFINTANARVLRFGINNYEPSLVALDGQPVQTSKISKDGISLAPGQRADLVVDIKGKPGDRIEIVETSGSEILVAGYLVCVAGSSISQHNRSPQLIANDLPEPDMTGPTRLELVMSGGAMRFLASAKFKGEEINGRELAQSYQQLWAFNGQAGMSDVPFFSAKRGETIILRMKNETAWPHAIHLHGHHFKVLGKGSLAGNQLNEVDGEERGAFRDTVLIERDEQVEVAFVADNPGKWMLHCHMLEHQASGMGTWFLVE